MDRGSDVREGREGGGSAPLYGERAAAATPISLRRRIAKCAGIVIKRVSHYLGAQEHHRFPQYATYDVSVPELA
jgi:hypothetical protein